MTLVWPFQPQMDVVETLEWKTDVIKCKRAEYRQSLRFLPRLEYRYKYLLDDVDYGVARELARVVGGDPVFVPDWTCATQVPTIGASTVSLPVDVTYAPAYKVGGSALIWGGNSTYEVVTVSALGTGTISISATASGYTKPWIVPLRLGTFMQEFSGDRGPHPYSEASAIFQAIVTEDLGSASGGLSYPTYLGDPVVTNQTEIINGAKESNIREVELLDSQLGPIYKYPVYATPNQSAVLAWTLQNAAEVWALRVWLHTRRAKWKQFWTLSWNDDVLINRNIEPGDSSIQIAAMGIGNKYTLPFNLAITNDAVGGFVALRITSIFSDGAGNETLSFTGTWSGSTWSLADGLHGNKLTLSRIDSDRIDIQHLPGRQATVVVATKEVPIYP